MLITRTYDDFDRAALPDNLGTGWLDQRGAGLGVLNNQAYSAAGVRSSLSTTGNLPGDQWAEVTIAAPGTAGGARGVGLVVRGSGTSGSGTENGYYFEVLTDGSNSYRIYKVIGNTETTIRGATALPETVTAGDVMRFEVEGTTLRAYLNDGLLTTETDLSIATGRAGLLVRGTAPRANDFESGGFIDVPEYTRVAVDSDNFNRPGGALGNEWANAGTGLAGFQITGNQVVGTATGVSLMSQYLGELPSFNQYASVTITDLGTTGSARQLNPWVRINGSEATRTGYGPNWRMDNGHLFIARRNADQTETVLAEFSPRMPSVNDVLTTEVVTVNGGNLIRVYINDELMGSAFDNTPGYEDGTTGLIGYRNTVRGDNFTTGVLQIDGTPSPVPVADTNALAEDGASLVVTGNVLDNDSPDGLSVSAVRFGASNGTVGSSLQGTFGTLVLNASGSYTYSLANASPAVQSLGVGETGQDIFTYTVNGPGGAASTTLTLTVTGANDAPVAAATSVTTDEGTAVTGSLPAATDVDGDAVTYALAADAAHGTVLVAANGGFSYTPDDDYVGLDAFTYSVSDGQGGSNTYTAAVTVNDGNEPPVDETRC